MNGPRGYLALVLHAHLPWMLGHGTWPHGEDWLHEAAAETYVPLLEALEHLADDGHRSLLTIDLSPVLCEQLADRGWQSRFDEYCRLRMESALGDQAWFARQGEQWKEVANPSGYGLDPEKPNTVAFDPIEATAMRLDVLCDPGVSAAPREWKIKGETKK